MPETRKSESRPMRVFVRPGSEAERICRRYAAGGVRVPQEPPPVADAAAPGFTPRPALNLRDRHGKIIADLVYSNFFVGGSAWSAQDRDNIDQNLAKAMSDQGLNNVLVQYFRGVANVTSTFRPSTLLPGAAPATISRSEEHTSELQSLR